MKILSIGLLAIGLMFGTIYSVHAESLTKKQVDKLADRIMENAPTINYDIKFEWLVLEDIKDNPEILNTAVMERIKKKYKVFDSRKDIPEEFKLYGKKSGVFNAYTKGGLFRYKIKFDSANTIIIYFSKYEGLLSAAAWQCKFKWNGKEWEQIYDNSTSFIVS